MVRWYLILLTALGVASGSLAAELSPKQVSVLERISKEKYAPRWDQLKTNELGELRLKVESYEKELRKSHLVGGLVVSLRYADTNRTQLVSYDALEDSAAWTGFYLASQAMRYAVERRTTTLDAVRQALDGLERLIQSSGRPGFLPRFAGPARDPAYQAVYSRYGGEDPQRPGFGRLVYPGTNGLVWLAGPSLDAYAGVNLGLALTYNYIRETGIRQRVSNIVEQLLGRLDRDGGVLDDGQGRKDFVPPLLSAALLRTGTSAVGREWATKYERMAGLIVVQHYHDDVGPATPKYDDLRSSTFTAGLLLALNRLETNANRKMLFQEKLSKLWRSGGPELNPWFAGAFLNVDDLRPRQNDLQGVTTDSIAMATLQGVLQQYPNWPRWAAPLPLPEDFKFSAVEANGRVWSRDNLPVFSRPVAAFQWTVGGHLWEPQAAAQPVIHPGIDLILPYWMGRNMAVIWPEDLAPLKRTTDPKTIRTGRTNAFGRLNSTNALTPVRETNAPAKKAP